MSKTEVFALGSIRLKRDIHPTRMLKPNVSAK